MMTTSTAQLSADRLALLYNLSQTFSSSLDLDQVLNQVMDEIIAATGAERGFVMLREEDGSLAFQVARGLDQQTIEDPQFQISRSIVERVAREGQALLTSDAQADSRFSQRQSIVNLKLRSILCAPLRVQDKIAGVVYVDNRLQAGIFSQGDLELLSAIASSAAIAIENARLYQIAVEKGRLERELQVAHTVQSSLLPQVTPYIEGWDFAAQWQPAREVSGDFYDFVMTEGGKLGLVIADVSDKGMPAALFMAVTRSIVRASIAPGLSAADSVAQANRLIGADATNGMFVTLFYAKIDPATGETDYVNAGHNPPLLYQADQGAFTPLTRTGMLLGVEDTAAFEQRRVELRSGDFLLLYTDGVTEATNEAGEEFGEARLREVIFRQRHTPAKQILSQLAQAVGDFTGSSAPFDDITTVVARRL